MSTEVLRRASPIIELGHTLGELHVAGSIRRQVDMVGDLDLVLATASEGALLTFKSRLPPGTQCEVSGVSKMNVVYDGVSVDVRRCSTDGLGAMLMHCTGSARFNIQMRARAQKRGMRLTEYGLFKGEELIAARTEEAIFRELGSPYLEPERRSK